MTKIANRWNVPRRKLKEVRREHLPSIGKARCIQHNGHGFGVGEIYDFHTEVCDGIGIPPYDVVRVVPHGYLNHSKDCTSTMWVFINSHEDLFSEHFEVV